MVYYMVKIIPEHTRDHFHNFFLHLYNQGNINFHAINFLKSRKKKYRGANQLSKITFPRMHMSWQHTAQNNKHSLSRKPYGDRLFSTPTHSHPSMHPPAFSSFIPPLLLMTQRNFSSFHPNLLMTHFLCAEKQYWPTLTFAPDTMSGNTLRRGALGCK